MDASCESQAGAMIILVAGRICVPILSLYFLEVRVTHVGTVSRLRTPKMSQLNLLQLDRKPMDLRNFLEFQDA